MDKKKSIGQMQRTACEEKSLVPRNVLILHKFREGKIAVTEAGANATGREWGLIPSRHAGIRLRAVKIDTPISDDIDYRIPVSQISHKNEHLEKYCDRLKSMH